MFLFESCFIVQQHASLMRRDSPDVVKKKDFNKIQLA